MTDHDVSLFPTIRDGNRRPQWFAACGCGWTGPARQRQSQCLIDQNQHERETKESAA